MDPEGASGANNISDSTVQEPSGTSNNNSNNNNNNNNNNTSMASQQDSSSCAEIALRLLGPHLRDTPSPALLLEHLRDLEHLPLARQFQCHVQAGELVQAGALAAELGELINSLSADKQHQHQHQHQHQNTQQLDLIRPPQIKPSRSLSIIIGDRDLEKHHHHEHNEQYNQQQQQQKQGIHLPAFEGKQARPVGLPTNKFGHKLHSQYSMPCSLNARRNTTYQVSHSLLDERLIFCQLSLVNKKDFAEEVRALLDVRKFVADSFILTDVSEVRIPDIVGSIVDRLAECRQLGLAVAEEARSQLFVERDSLSMVLANTMQGLYKSRTDGRLAYDHNWIVATASLAGLSKRQVAIARLPHPVNFGRQSQEVRFLVLVLAPSKEKLTKSAWETGRTFATMFTDIEFRRRLLKAKSQEEIKVEMLVRAESLAREHERRNSATSTTSGSSDGAESGSEADESARVQARPYSLSYNVSAAKKRALQQVACCTGTSLEDSFERFDAKLVRSQFNHQTSRSSHSSGSSSSAASTSVASAKQITGVSGSGGGGGGSQGRGRKTGSSSGKRMRSKEQQKRGNNNKKPAGCCGTSLGAGLADDLKRRAGWYLSDFTDGLVGERSLYKTISTTIFLYFSVLLPCIAFGVVDTNNTDGNIDPKKTMIGQALGGLFFALFSGQPLVVVMTTAPLCIYVKVIYQISQDLEVDFGSFYACTGLWMAAFLVVMSVTNASNFMKHCTRSTEDIFAIFTAFAFGSDGVREAIRSFQKYYWEPDCGVHQIQQHVLVSRATGGSNSVGGPETTPLNLTTRHHAYHATAATAHSIDSALSVVHHEVASSASAAAAAAAASAGNSTTHTDHEAAFALASQAIRCQRETCILFMFLMCGTLWLANSFNSFDRTPYLSTRKREVIKDYALAIAVLIFSFVGSYMFADVKLDVFEFGDFTGLHLHAQLSHLSYGALATSCLLGFMAAVLFYIDQNICGAMVNNAPYKLKKGNYFHLDLLVLAILNAFLSLTGLPWMHGKLPHSHLHSKALADYEERVDEGHVHQTIVDIRETRMTGILVSLLVAASLLAVPYPLSYIPLPVLSGVFLYTALAEFKSNSMVERICLLFTEQVAYPPNHYIRRCPQRKIHLFTLAQILQLAIVSFIGFYPNPYVNMAFPLAVATFVPLRELLLPKLIDTKYLHSLDTASLE